MRKTLFMVDYLLVKMRIILVNNKYRSSSPSGENIFFELESDLLSKNNHDVFKFTRESDKILNSCIISKVISGICVPWNEKSRLSFVKYVNDIKPDIIHFHNLFPLISNSVLYGIDNNICKVMTFHNYRNICSNALMSREGMSCTLCLDKSFLHALRYKCYRNSLTATVPLVASIVLHKYLNTLEKKIDAFCVMSDNQKKTMVKYGISEDKFYVKPNFYIFKGKVQPWVNRENYVVYVGRLSLEKGVGHIVDAWIKWGPDAPELRIMGDGPLRECLVEKVKQSGLSNVKFLGFVSDSEKQIQISRSKLLVMPSLENTETFGIVLVEAFASGTPVAVSNVSPMNKISIDNITGVVFEPSNPYSVFNVISNIWKMQERLESFSVNARKEYLNNYTGEKNYNNLMKIYNDLLERKSSN